MKTDRNARPSALTASDRIRMATPIRGPRRDYGAVRAIVGAALAIAALPAALYVAGAAYRAVMAAGHLSHVAASASGAAGAFVALSLVVIGGKIIMGGSR